MSCGDCMSKLLQGAAGLAKAGLQAVGIPVDQADAETARERLEVCRACPELMRSPDPRFAANQGLTTLSRCGKCDCFVVAKVGIGSEGCPLGRW